MEQIWRLLVAVFILLAAIAMTLMALLFQNTVIAGVCIYGALILIPWGIVKGVKAILDNRNRDKE